MQTNEYKRLGLIQKLLKVAIVLLIIAELSYILLGMFDYIWGVVGALAVLAVRFGMFKFSKQRGWVHIALMIIPVMMIVAPLIYIVVGLFMGVGGVSFINLFLVCAFIVPILIMFYAGKVLQDIQLHNEAE